MRSAGCALAILLLLVGCASCEVGTGRAASGPSASTGATGTVVLPCPEDMVIVSQRFCIDRYEATMVDERTGQAFSPFYPPNAQEMRKAVNGQPWGLAAIGREQLRPPVPLLPEWQRLPEARARAVSRKGVVPQGYLSRPTAKAACEASGKRLCTIAEWKVACRGEQDTRFPYGPTYRHGACNIRQHEHAAAILWGDASLGHWDPRLNQVSIEGTPLVKPTGDTTTCRSPWGADGIYDMVGNLDEWVDDAGTKGTFVGGFYARDTVRGCDAKVSEHPGVFFDFSTGVRCCAELRR